ncbi:hypothetical protein FNV43_RR20370 [Rhamnella rubrinervis]|uniref:Uncharacterized protein n=1 Tax=Rhamnella rubrinervis TaxID=2594499 RepID=A0A8K0E113_9ROSA|nr:hypothetical protein FNV43_RR20370 [Rhamnella rubrinervis]
MVGVHVPQGLDDCELIQFSNPQNTHFEHWSMVVIRDSAAPNDCSVFPPNNHENLHLHEREEHPLSPSSSASSSSSSLSSSSSFSPSDTDSSDPESPLPSDARVQKTGGKANSWLSIGFEVLRSKLLAFALPFGYNGGGIRWGIQSFGSTAGVLAMVVMLWSLYMRGRHRRRSRENLMLLVKEKDEVSLIVPSKVFDVMSQSIEFWVFVELAIFFNHWVITSY